MQRHVTQHDEGMMTLIGRNKRREEKQRWEKRRARQKRERAVYRGDAFFLRNITQGQGFIV